MRKGLGRVGGGARGGTGLCLQKTRDKGARVGGARGLGETGTGAWLGHGELGEMTVVL